jgi:hypothetical protein
MTKDHAVRRTGKKEHFSTATPMANMMPGSSRSAAVEICCWDLPRPIRRKQCVRRLCRTMQTIALIVAEAPSCRVARVELAVGRCGQLLKAAPATVRRRKALLSLLMVLRQMRSPLKCSLEKMPT